MNRRQKRDIELFGAILIVLLLIFIYSGFRLLESTVFFQKETHTISRTSRTITKDGVEYFPRQDMTVFMVMGIDQEGKMQDSGSYNNAGAADAIMLMAFKDDDKSVSVLTLNRDTMVEMPVLGVGGKQAGSIYGELALSHTYGNGLQESCENTKDTVSALLSGLYIDYYVAMNMDAIAILNDAVGGVPVTVTEDFSAVDPTITMGDITLQGKQATNYVRSRAGVGDELNVSRMERQEKYVDSFLDILKQKANTDNSFILQTYENISDYMVTNCSSTIWGSTLSKYQEYTLKEIVSPEGQNVKGETYMEYHLDEKALDDLVLRLFYAPKKLSKSE